MGVTPLRYAGYSRSVDVANVVVDGSPNAGTLLVLSHWPGMTSPAGVEADTSCQMEFRYLDRGAALHDDARTVTNNHFDQDGLAGIYPLTDPEDGMRRRAQLEALAAAGDFGVASDRSAARISMAVSALADPETSPLTLPDDYDEACVVLYERPSPSCRCGSTTQSAAGSSGPTRTPSSTPPRRCWLPVRCASRSIPKSTSPW